MNSRVGRMPARIAAIAAVCLLTTTCGGDDDPSGDTSTASGLLGARSDRAMVQDGIVVVDLQSSAPRYTDRVELDVTAAGDDVNESSVFAVCTGLTGGDGPFRVGVTDLRRVKDDRTVLSVELTAVGRVREPGEFDVDVLLIDGRQRQQKLTGRLTIDDERLRQGSFTITDGRNTQVRGSFRCGEKPSDVTTTTSNPGTPELGVLRVRVVAGAGAENGVGERDGTLNADRKDLGDIDPADTRAPAHCSGVVSPDTDRYVVRLESDAAGDGSGRLQAFELVVRNARDANANGAQLTARFGKGTVAATGVVTFAPGRTSGKFRGSTESGVAVQASFRCRDN